MKSWIQAAAAVAFCVTAAVAHAETAAEARAMLAEAHAMVASKGMTAAAAEINAGGKWKRAKAYVVLTDYATGELLAHADNPKLAGKVMIEAKDASGKAFVKETVQNIKAKGESLIDYRWANPTTKKIDNGHLLARRVAGHDVYVAVGYWD
jgi:signal transduction histidine kinase